MCFPGKRQKDLLSDSAKSASKQPAAPAPEEEPPTQVPAEPTTAVNTTTAPPTELATEKQSQTAEMSSPRIAIIIYSMYGHISKSGSDCCLPQRI